MILRPPRDDEFDAMLELTNAHQLAVFGEADTTADELQTWLTSPSVVVERDIRVLERDGRLVGYVGEVVTELVSWLEERATAGRLRVWTSNDDARVRAVFESLGFTPSRHSYRMEIDLGGAVGEPAWPAGVSVRTLRGGEELRVYEAAIEVWQDTTDPMDDTFEEWSHWLVKQPTFDPSLWFLALDGDELAGFSLCRQDPLDQSAGYVWLLGVRRPWRRQGLGEALLLRSFQAFRERGYTRGTLGVDASSPTGATRLYERAGMRIYRDTLFLERPVRR